MPEQSYLGLVSANNPPGGVQPGVPVTVDEATGALTFVNPVTVQGVSQQSVRVGHAQVPDVWYMAGMWNIVLAQALAVNVLRAVPFVTGKPFTIDRLAFNITSVGGAGSRTRIGIYRAAGGVGLPSSLLVAPAEHITDGGAADTRISTFDPTTLSDPVYWFAYLTGASGVGPTIRTIAATDGNPLFGLLGTDLNTRRTHVTVAQAYGALPDPFTGGAAFAADNYPVLACRGV